MSRHPPSEDKRETYNVVVLAAHRLGLAGVAGGDADGRDGGAAEANLGGGVLEDDTEEGEKGGRGIGVGLDRTHR